MYTATKKSKQSQAKKNYNGVFEKEKKGRSPSIKGNLHVLSKLANGILGDPT